LKTYETNHLLSIAIMSGIDYLLANVPSARMGDEKVQEFADRYQQLKKEVADYLISNSIGAPPQERIQHPNYGQYELDLKVKK